MSQPPAPGRPPPLAVIADDLTGSCDTAAQFSRFGMRVAVTGASAPDRPLDLDLLVVNTASRGLPAERAREAAARSAKALLASGSRPVYKKIDSTLKGPWCQELAAVMAVVRPDLTLVAPAFPAWRRTTRGGTLLLDGRPLPPRSARAPGTTEIGSGDLLGRLRAEFGSQVELVRRHLLRQAPATVEKRILTARRKGHRVLLFDIESDSDLERLAVTGRRLDESVLWVGSAGLARFLPLSWGVSQTPAAPAGLHAKGPLLLICGSLNLVNMPQLEQLGQRGLATAITLRDEDTDSPPRMENKLKQALETLARQQSVALSLRLEPAHSLPGPPAATAAGPAIGRRTAARHRGAGGSHPGGRGYGPEGLRAVPRPGHPNSGGSGTRHPLGPMDRRPAGGPAGGDQGRRLRERGHALQPGSLPDRSASRKGCAMILGSAPSPHFSPGGCTLLKSATWRRNFSLGACSRAKSVAVTTVRASMCALRGKGQARARPAQSVSAELLIQGQSRY